MAHSQRSNAGLAPTMQPLQSPPAETSTARSLTTLAAPTPADGPTAVTTNPLADHNDQFQAAFGVIYDLCVSRQIFAHEYLAGSHNYRHWACRAKEVLTEVGWASSLEYPDSYEVVNLNKVQDARVMQFLYRVINGVVRNRLKEVQETTFRDYPFALWGLLEEWFGRE